MSNHLTILTFREIVDKQGTRGEHIYNIRSSHELLQGPIERESPPIAVDISLLNNLYNEFGMIASEVNRGMCDPIERFKSQGRTVYKQLFGDKALGDIKNDLYQLETPLLISTAQSYIPWELLHDGQDFFGLKYIKGRQLRTHANFTARTVEKAPSRCLIVANATCDEEITDTENQALTLKSWLKERGIACEYLAREQATRNQVLTHLTTGDYDIFHYSGHVSHIIDESRNSAENKQSSEYALCLYDGPLRTSDIEKAVDGISIAFINGCSSAVSVESLTVAFIMKGAQLVIGTIFDVPPLGARVFAETFYENALNSKSVGEAMREAREKTKEKPECGAAWASYVMYGDPCLKIAGDVLPKSLRKKWDDNSRHVIEDCVTNSRSLGSICTPSLFIAMLKGEDSRLRDGLNIQGVNAEELKELLEKVLEAEKNESIANTGSELPRIVSSNVTQIVDISEKEVKRLGRDKISERDLQVSFVLQGGGSTGKALRESKIVDWNKLKKYITNGEPIDDITPDLPYPEDDNSLGPLDKDKCDELAWTVIEQSKQIVSKSGGQIVGTPQLFTALLKNQNGSAGRSLRSLGISSKSLMQIRDEFEKIMGNTDRSSGVQKRNIVPSESVEDVLRLSIELAESEKRLVTEPDLWTAFLKNGGGRTRTYLRERFKIELDVLTTKIFLSNGYLDQSRFAEEARAALNIACQNAKATGWEGITTPHFLTGLCSVKNGIAAALVAKQGFDPQELITLINRNITRSGAIQRGSIDLVLHYLSARLRQILVSAEEMASKDGSSLITDRHLLLSFLNEKEGGGITAEILKASGLDLSVLMQRAEEYTD